MIEELGKFLTTFLAGATGIWKGIPVGIALGLKPFYTATLTSMGAITSALAVYFSGEPFRKWLLSKYGDKNIARKREKFSFWLEKYGIGGLGLLATGLLGPFIALIIGMLLLNDTRKFIVFLVIGIILWSFGITYLSDPIVNLVKAMF